MSSSERKHSDPVESLSSYIMVHGGIDKTERLADVEWVRDVVTAARDVAGSFSESDMDAAIDKMRRVLRERYV